MRKQIAICLANDVFVRNFVESGALSDLEVDHDITYVLAEEVKKELPGKRVVRVENCATQKRTVFRYKTGYLSMRRFSERSRSFPLKYKFTLFQHLRPISKILFFLLSLPGVYEVFNWLVEFRLATLPALDRLFSQNKFSLVIVPSAFSDSFSLDCIKSCRKFKIKSLMLMFNWDNVSCKGVLSYLPTALGVWGLQTKEQAQKIHKLQQSSVAVLGAPQFEVYFGSRERVIAPQLRLIQERFHGRKVLLYLGIARYRDELALLTQLEEAIESGKLENTCVIYRAHPWKEVSVGEKNFYDCNFKHVVLDPQVEENYQRIFGILPAMDGKFSPSYDYLPGLLSMVDGVISSLTTLGIEAMLMGKPLLLPVFPDKKFSFSVDTLIDYEHHQCWKRFPDVLLCTDESLFVRDCLELLQLAKRKDLPLRLQEAVKYVVHFDQRPYSRRLQELVEGMI